MAISTKQGDGGTTRLFSGEELPKSDPRLEVQGDLDELISHLGLSRSLTVRLEGEESRQLALAIIEVQKDLCRFAAELSCRDVDDAKARGATPTEASHVADLEARIDELEKRIGPLKSFIIPGACEASAAMDMARAVSRRVERRIVQLAIDGIYANPEGTILLNRLSDYLFLLARAIERCAGIDPSSEE